MRPSADISQEASQELAHRVARLLRHEVGDLLQSVYTSTAVLLERLAGPLDAERRLLEDLKGRAELCKLELDAVVALVSPEPHTWALVDLAATARAAVDHARRRHPSLSIRFNSASGHLVRADAGSLPGALTFLVHACCQAARQQVEVLTSKEDLFFLLEIRRDGFPVSPEQLAWLDQPFATTHNTTFGLGLALARRALGPSGGKVAVVNRDGGGICVRLQFPTTDG